MLDTSPKIKLSKKFHRVFLSARLIVFGALMVVAVHMIISVMFPAERGKFSFDRYDLPANTIAFPRYDSENLLLDGNLEAGREMRFNYTARGVYKNVRVTLESYDENLATQRVSVVRSYQSFLLPLGEPVRLREGTLIEYSGNKFIVSDGQLRKFDSDVTLDYFGISPDAFISVDKETFAIHARGEDVQITQNTQPYLVGMVIAHKGVYYQVTPIGIKSFVSERAFVSRYSKKVAIPVSDERFSGFTLSNEHIGFLDGTILSYGAAAYVVSGNEVRPIASPEAFETKGYDWNNIIEATGEEFGLYTRGRLYTIQQPHPDGTVFITDADEVFLLENGKKHPITSSAIRDQYTSIGWIKAGVSDERDCALEESGSEFMCVMNIRGIREVPGHEYEFRFTAKGAASLHEIKVYFDPVINMAGVKAFFIDLKTELLKRIS